MGGAQDVNDESLRYQGWCVVVASSVGLFFASSFFMTFALLLRPSPTSSRGPASPSRIAFGAMTLSVALSTWLMGHLRIGGDRCGSRVRR